VNTLPFDGSAFVQWDSLRGNWPAGNGLRSPDNDAHYATRWMPAFQQTIPSPDLQALRRWLLSQSFSWNAE
jgi:hypothetical protein